MTQDITEKDEQRPMAGSAGYNEWLVRNIFKETKRGTFERAELRFLRSSLEIGMGLAESKPMESTEREAKSRVLEKLAVSVARLEMVGKMLELNTTDWRFTTEQLHNVLDPEALARFIAAAARRFGPTFADPIARALKESYADRGERLQAVRELSRFRPR